MSKGFEGTSFGGVGYLGGSGGSGSGGSGIAIPENYQFANIAARDAFFAGSPAERVAGVQIAIADLSVIQEFNGVTGVWDDITAYIRGQRGG